MDAHASPEWDGWSVRNMGHPAPVPGREYRVLVRDSCGDTWQETAVYLGSSWRGLARGTVMAWKLLR
jgi:hypothetical protein